MWSVISSTNFVPCVTLNILMKQGIVCRFRDSADSLVSVFPHTVLHISAASNGIMSTWFAAGDSKVIENGGYRIVGGNRKYFHVGMAAFPAVEDRTDSGRIH